MSAITLCFFFLFFFFSPDTDRGVFFFFFLGEMVDIGCSPCPLVCSNSLQVATDFFLSK
jgi:hypothetical protein